MQNLNSSQKKSPKPQLNVLSFQLVQNAEPDRVYYLQSTLGKIENFFSKRVNELYNTLAMTFCLDSMDWGSFSKYIWPVISSGAAVLMGDYLTRGVSQSYTGSEDYQFIFKFLLGTAVLGHCALHRITDKTYTSPAAVSAAIASEVMAITFAYSSVFSGTRFLLGDAISDEYSLIAGLGASAIAVPSGLSYLSQKMQGLLVRRQYSQGAQRSDTAAISSGLTPISNWYFQINHFIAQELQVSSRVFQLGLIAHNIRHADKIVQQFRNLPALLADLAPSTIKKMRIQQEKLAYDDAYNHQCYRVLKFVHGEAVWEDVPGYLLRTGDLVYCDARIDLERVPVSGELVALQRNEQGHFVQKIERQKFRVNLKAHNGEEHVWIEHQSKPDLTSNYTTVDIQTIKAGKQPGVLVADKLNLYGCDNFFIQIKPEKELLLSNHYEKTAVINEIITKRKQKSVFYSILGSIVAATLLERDINLIPATTLNLMFTLFQTMIPFSEAFLRDTINSRLLKKLNTDLGDQSFECIDALRVVDFCNALSGYYRDQFPNGVVLLSDKTGTLTETRMDVVGLWVPEMAAEVQNVLKEREGLLLPAEPQWLEAFEVFCSAFTHDKNEPEEQAILNVFKSLLSNPQCLEVTTYGNNHFKKVITGKGVQKEIETFHLGLYAFFGGRFTLVQEGHEFYLVFCGIPKSHAFQETSLLQAYTTMQTRTAVLSRDWCVARSKLSEQEFVSLKQCFDDGINKADIQNLIAKNTELLKRFTYFGTFIINNPVKKGAEQFIEQCRNISVPVFVVTGDNTKAAENIAKTLCPENAQKIITMNAEELDKHPLEFFDELQCPADSTVIFSGLKGVNADLLARFQKLMDREKHKRPVIIFSEMSTEGKGLLARYLSERRYFVVASGDGPNDLAMMKEARMVISHPAEDGSFGPGVKDLSNISAEQVRRLFGSDKTFYELFDIHLPKSLFVQKFAPLANSQEKPTMALALKSGKMTFDLAKALGLDVREMHQQHWYSVAFDLLWLWISFYEINESADLPMDNRHINASRLISNAMAISLLIGAMQALVNYAVYDESTNVMSMLMVLSFLPLVLKSIFSGFRMVQENLYPSVEVEEVVAEDANKSVLSYMGTFFLRRRHPEGAPSPAVISLHLE